MIEIIGSITMLLALIGVYQNNCRRRICFIFFTFSNTLLCITHIFYYGNISLAVGDLIFTILAVHGFFKWRKADEKIKDAFANLEMIAKNRNKSKKRNRHLRKP